MQWAQGVFSNQIQPLSSQTMTLGSYSALFALKAFHSTHEVMASDHIETHLQPAASIVSKCSIHTLEQYMVRHVAFMLLLLMSR